MLDLSETVAGQFCARMFADNGADVRLGEPIDGSVIRQVPIVGDESCLFAHLNAGKKSFKLDLTSPTGRDQAANLADQFDVIVSAPDGAVLELLKTSTTTTVICDITPFGRGTDWRDWQGGELIYQALSGVMFENGTTGLPPLYGVGHRASYAAGAIGYLQMPRTAVV